MGPPKILGIGETGGAATYRSQTFKVARYCARERLGGKDIHEDAWHPVAHGRDVGMGQTPARPGVARAPAAVAAWRSRSSILGIAQ